MHSTALLGTLLQDKSPISSFVRAWSPSQIINYVIVDVSMFSSGTIMTIVSHQIDKISIEFYQTFKTISESKSKDLKMRNQYF